MTSVNTRLGGFGEIRASRCLSRSLRRERMAVPFSFLVVEVEAPEDDERVAVTLF
jgi:hypothetical protein